MRKIILGLVVLLTSFLSQAYAQTEDFESTAVGSVPNGWVTYQTGNDDPGFQVDNQNGYAHGGTNYLVHEGADLNAESTSWVVSNVMHVGTGYELKFFWRGRWTSAYNFSGAYISIASNDPISNPGDFTLLKEFSPDNYPNTWLQWNEEAMELSNYENQNIYLAFKYVGDHAHDFFIDDITVSPMPYCEPPTDLTVVNRSMNSLGIEWTATLGVNDFEIVWGAPGFDPNGAGVTPVMVSGSYNYQITGLSQSTSYDIYIRSACSSYNLSSWEGPVTGITAGPPPANDDCDNAIALTVNADLSCTNTTHGTTVNATASAQPDDVTGTPNNDVWFSFTATQSTHKISLLNVVAIVGTSTDMGMGLYDGANGCGSLALVDDSDPNEFSVSGLIPGNTYYLRVYGWSSNVSNGQEFDVCVGTPPPPPANDDCSSALNLDVYDIGMSAGNEVSGNTEFATDSNMHPTCDDIGTNLDLWYTFTVPAGETSVMVITNGAQGNKIEAALYDTCGGTELDCQGQGSHKIFSGLTAGTTYTLQIWHDETYKGEFEIAIEKVPGVPANDDCDNATPITVNTDSTCHTLTSGTTVNATASSQPDDVTGTPNNDVWFSFVAPDSSLNISLLNVVAVIGSSTDMGMGLYDGSNGCSSLSLVDDSDPNSFTVSGLTVGNTYYLRVYGWSDDVNGQNFDVCVKTLALPPSYDTCSNAMVLPVTNSCANTIVTNDGATDSGETSPSCANYQGGDIWFTVEIPSSGHVIVETNSAANSSVTDTGMAVYSGTCGSLNEIDCDDDDGTGYFSSIELSGRTPGEIIYVRVWEYGNNSFGDITICAHDAAVALDENQIEGLKIYPNPAKNILNISAQKNIESISLFNISGQAVMSVYPNKTKQQIDISQIPQGVYFVKIQVNGQLTATKLVKE
jgi:hypothetical protein